jgi:hypothetical protein
MVAPLLPQAVQRAHCRSSSLEVSGPHRMTGTAHASGAWLGWIKVLWSLKNCGKNCGAVRVAQIVKVYIFDGLSIDRYCNRHDAS